MVLTTEMREKSINVSYRLVAPWILMIYYFISVTSLEFWKQVKRKNIDELEATYAYKHDFELFGYSIKDYLKKIKYSD